MSKRIIITANAMQLEALTEIMKMDMETNVSAYIGRLIVQEKLRRDQKKSVGRPKKVEENENLYPAPYKDGGLYTEADLKAYYEFRGQEMPPLPKPLTQEEIKARGY